MENKRKIGDPVWVFDSNYRVYREKNQGPVWREHWRKREITGETSRSWIIGKGYSQLKIPKNGTQSAGICWSEEEIDRQQFVHDHVYLISGKVSRVRDYDTLKKIADLVGYEVKPVIDGE